MSLAPGTRLGSYEITAAIGAGGMGEVYRAHDPRLNRDVAIKVLPDDLRQDPKRRERFRREAEAVASLNHAHICTLHDIGQHDGTDFLVMELLEGETLAKCLQKGALPLEDALRYGAEIADALATAHKAGVVHRDLKPGNIMLTKAGAKLLDFGLAKLKPSLGTGESTTHLEVTAEGSIIGTVQYMAPEQIEGRDVDARTDIFAFGAMLYEMVTGQKAFTGRSHVSLMGAILKDDPPTMTEVQPLVPRALEHVVQECLQKDPDDRRQSAGDVGRELKWVSEERATATVSSEGSPVVATPGRSRERLAWVVLVVAGVSLAAWIAFSWSRAGSSAWPPIEVTFTQLTSTEAIETSPSLSPDGNWVVYASAGDIHLRSVGGQNAINLTKDEPASDSQPAFSPDGRIAFRSARGGGGLWVMRQTGEDVKRLTDRGFHPAWTPDGGFVVFSTHGTLNPDNRRGVSEGWKVEVATGRKTQITPGDFMQPAVSPGGHRIAYWANSVGDRDLWTVGLDGSDPVRVTDDAATDWSPVWSPDGGVLYFASDRGGTMNLWRVPIDEASGRVLGPPEAITTPSPWMGLMGRSDDGQRFVYASYAFTGNISRVAFDPARGTVTGDPEPITTGTLDWWMPEPSRDGTKVVLTSWHRQEALYLAERDEIGSWKLTDLTRGGRNRRPSWSPDDTQILFYSNRAGPYSVWTINPDGSGLRERISLPTSLIWPLWSPDGLRVMVAQTSLSRTFVFALADEVVSEPIETLPPRPDSDAVFAPWSWSPDGQFIAGYAGSPRTVWVYSLDTKTYMRIATGQAPVWLGDSRRLVYASNGQLFVVDTVTKESRLIHADPEENLGYPSLTHDNGFLYYRHATIDADIWLMTIK